MKTTGELNISTRIRQTLRVSPDGMTVQELSEHLNKQRMSVGASLKAMPDSYIDRWVMGDKEYVPVWCVVVPPLDCPKPTKSYKQLKQELKDEGRTQPKTSNREVDRGGHVAFLRRA